METNKKTMTNEPLRRYDYLDFTRALALVLVVLLHTAAILLVEYDINPGAWWWIGNIIDTLARIGVPLFIMVSGTLLLDPSKNESLSIFFIKRLRRVLIPFVFWAIVFLLWRSIYQGEHIPFPAALKIMTSGPIYYHLWFIYMLLGLYLVTPVLRVWVKGAEQKDLLYFLVLWFVAASVVPFINRFFHIRVGIDFVVTTYYVGYFVLGYYLHNYPIPEKFNWLSLAAFAGGLFLTIFGTYFLTVRHNGEFDGYLFSYLSPNVVLMSVFLFDRLRKAPLKFMQQKGNRLTWIVAIVSSTSFSVFLMHPIVLELLDRGYGGYNLNAKFIHPLIGIPLSVIVIISICIVILMALRKVPGFKYILQ